MEKFERERSVAAPLMQINIDTDQIIPARFMPRVLIPGGLKEGLFAEWRLEADGTPKPGFILNRAPFDQARILIAGRNFGCGSSREQAPKAMRQWGLRAVVAPSFGEIFYGNCFRNGIVPVQLPEQVVQGLAQAAGAGDDGAIIAIDLATQTLTDSNGRLHGFSTPERLRRMLLSGLDEIDLTLTHAGQIEKFRQADRTSRPWAYQPANPPD